LCTCADISGCENCAGEFLEGNANICETKKTKESCENAYFDAFPGDSERSPAPTPCIWGINSEGTGGCFAHIDLTGGCGRTLVIFVHGLGGESGDVFWLFAETLLERAESKGMTKNIDIQFFTYNSMASNKISAENFNKALLEEYGADSYNRIYIIAHSLGNIIVRDAVSQMPSNTLPNKIKLSEIYGKTKVFEISPIFGGAEMGKWVILPFAGIFAARWKEFQPGGKYQSNLFSGGETEYFTNLVLDHYAFIVVNDFQTLGVWNQLRKESKGSWHIDLFDLKWKILFCNAAFDCDTTSKNYFEFYLEDKDRIDGRSEIKIDKSSIIGGNQDRHTLLMFYFPLVNQIVNQIVSEIPANFGSQTSSASGSVFSEIPANFGSQTSSASGAMEIDYCNKCLLESDCDILCNSDANKAECNNLCNSERIHCFKVGYCFGGEYCPEEGINEATKEWLDNSEDMRITLKRIKII